MPSIDSNILDTNENIAHVNDESSKEDESEAPMQRRIDMSALTPDVN